MLFLEIVYYLGTNLSNFGKFVILNFDYRTDGRVVRRQLVCPRSLYVEVLVPTQKHKLCQTFTKTAILNKQIWEEI